MQGAQQRRYNKPYSNITTPGTNAVFVCGRRADDLTADTAPGVDCIISRNLNTSSKVYAERPKYIHTLLEAFPSLGDVSYNDG